MAVTPTGARGEAIVKLEELLAASTTFRNRIRTAVTDEEVLDRILYPWQEDDDCEACPFAVIDEESQRDSRDSTATFLTSGSLSLRIYDRLRMPAETISQRKDAYIELLNFFDGVTADLKEASLVDDALAIQRLEVEPVVYESPLEVVEQDDVRPHYVQEYVVNWSPHGAAG